MLARLLIPVLVLLWSGGLAQLQVQVSSNNAPESVHS